VKSVRIPSVAVSRLAFYERKLELLSENGVKVISSVRLADICGVNPAQIRKDLAYFGQFGVRGVGYYVKELLFETRKILSRDRDWRLGLVGVGNLGSSLLNHAQHVKQGYTFVAAFDIKPERIGGTIGNVEVSPLEAMNRVVKERGVEIGVIAVKPTWAQTAADMAIDAGIRGILNFAPVQLQCPSHVFVENVDYSIRLDLLCYRLTSSRSRRPRIKPKLGA
jgi:redox-sensing transcriptional repressor